MHPARPHVPSPFSSPSLSLLSLITATSNEFQLYDLDRLRDGGQSRGDILLPGPPHSLLSSASPRPGDRLVEVSWLPGDHGIFCSLHQRGRESGDLLVWDASRLMPVEMISLSRSQSQPANHPQSMLMTGASAMGTGGLFDVAIGGSGCVHLVDLRAGALVQRLSVPSGGGGVETVFSLAWDGQWSLHGGTDRGRLMSWDARRAEGRPFDQMPRAMQQCITQLEWLASPRAGHLLCGTTGGQSLGLVRLPERQSLSSVAETTGAGGGKDAVTNTANTDDDGELIVWRAGNARVPSTAGPTRWVLATETAPPLLICPETGRASGLRAYDALTGELQWARLTPEADGPRDVNSLGMAHFEHLLYDPRGLQLISISGGAHGTVQFFPL